MLRDERLEPAISNVSHTICHCVIILRNAITSTKKKKKNMIISYDIYVYIF